ncbi:MAG: OmpA family protein, partial [Actinomycetota bacterium]|nr:OmpA family protein [Actinomycetota bacterium]
MIDSAGVAASNARAMVMVPSALSYVPGSSTLDGAPLADPEDASGTLTWRLPEGAADWQRTIGFATELRVAPVAAPKEVEKFTFHGNFASCKDELLAESYGELMALMKKLRDSGAERLEIVGHTDNQRLSPTCKARFTDNQGLSRARAQTIANAASTVLGLDPSQITTDGKGPDVPVASNGAPEGMAKNRRVEVLVVGRKAEAAVEDVACGADGYAALKAAVSVDTAAAKAVRLPVVENRVVCGSAADTRPAETVARDNDSGRMEVVLKHAEAVTPAPAAPAEPETVEDASVKAAGGGIDWLAQAVPGETGFLFPPADHNPRAPAIRVVVQHEPTQRAEVFVNGAPASALNYDGIRSDKKRNVAVSVWRGLPLVEGANYIRIRVLDDAGALVREDERAVHFANAPARAEMVPELSQLVADGITRPRIAVRFLDRDGKPVRTGVSIGYRLDAPYATWESVANLQERQLAG